MRSRWTEGVGTAPAPVAWIAALTVAFTFVVVRSAWVCDDAYITFRTVDNLLAGHGAVWNVGERVQAYTHPAWMALVAAATTVLRDPYPASLLLGVLLSAAAVFGLARRGATSLAGATLAVLVLAASKAFVDYSTSGLENPLTHLLLVGALLVAARDDGEGPRGAFLLALALSGLWLTRPDAVLLVAPLFALHLARHRSLESFSAATVGLAPAFVWLLFSVLYYGRLVPNTARAKLATGIPPQELWAQGVEYLAQSASVDPVTLGATLVGLACALGVGGRAGVAGAVGIGLHLLYVVRVGGDFMSGRFLTPPLLCAVWWLSRAPFARGGFAFAALLTLLAGTIAPGSPLRAPTHYGMDRPPPEHVDDDGISDERAYWYGYTGLFSPRRGGAAPPFDHVTEGHGFAFKLRDEGPKLLTANGIGFLGYFAGPTVHIVDPMGLSDAFLAELPVWGEGGPRDPANAFRGRAWRVGHYVRRVPDGYLASIESGETRVDPDLAALYERVRLVTRGALFDRARLSAALELAFGGRDPGIERLRPATP